MEDIKVPLELVSVFLSIVVVIAMGYKFYQYKQNMDILKTLEQMKINKKLAIEDKDFVSKNIQDYKTELMKSEAITKLVYPVFITIAATLLYFLTVSEAMIHFNVVVVVFLFLHLNKLHTKNLLIFLEKLKSTTKE